MDYQKIRETALACYDTFSEEQKERAFAIFEAMDSDGGGTVSLSEYEEYFGRSDQFSFDELDADGNAQLDYEEFITLFYVMLTSNGASTTQPLIVIPQEQPRSSRSNVPKPAQSNQVSRSDSQLDGQYVSRSDSRWNDRSDSESVRRSESGSVRRYEPDSMRRAESGSVRRSERTSGRRSESGSVHRYESDSMRRAESGSVRRTESGSVRRTESGSVRRTESGSDSESIRRTGSSGSGSKREKVLKAITDFNNGWAFGTAISTVAVGVTGAALCTIM